MQTYLFSCNGMMQYIEAETTLQAFVKANKEFSRTQEGNGVWMETSQVTRNADFAYHWTEGNFFD